MRRTCVTFHGTGTPPAGLSPGELAVWVDGAVLPGLLDVIAEQPGAEISFDDGNRSDLEVALPLLTQRGLTATFFVVTDRVGVSGYLGAQDLDELVAAGMTVGSHGVAHRSWRGLTATELEHELCGSRAALAAIGHPVDSAACPFGAYDRRVLRAARRAGYSTIHTSDGAGPARPGWLVPRISVRAEDNADSLRARMRLSRSPRDIAVRLAKRWR